MTRNNGMKLKGRCKTNVGKIFFTDKVIENWNKLPSKHFKVKTINIFITAKQILA